MTAARFGTMLLCASLPVAGCVCEQGSPKQVTVARPRELAFFDFVRPADVARLHLWPVDDKAPKRKKSDLLTRQEGQDLSAKVDGRDPYFSWDFEESLRAGVLSVELESDTEGQLQLFWADDRCKTYDERCSTSAPLGIGRQTVDFVLDPGRPLHGVRLDLPQVNGAKIRIQHIRVLDRPRLGAGYGPREKHTQAMTTGDGLRLSSQEPDPWLTISTPWLEAEQVESVEIELVSQTDAVPELFWHGEACSNFHANCRAVLAPMNGKSNFFSARLADVAAWRGKIRGLRLDPGEPAGQYLLKSLTLVRRPEQR